MSTTTTRRKKTIMAMICSEFFPIINYYTLCFNYFINVQRLISLRSIIISSDWQLGIKFGNLAILKSLVKIATVFTLQQRKISISLDWILETLQAKAILQLQQLQLLNWLLAQKLFIQITTIQKMIGMDGILLIWVQSWILHGMVVVLRRTDLNHGFL